MAPETMGQGNSSGGINRPPIQNNEYIERLKKTMESNRLKWVQFNEYNESTQQLRSKFFTMITTSLCDIRISGFSIYDHSENEIVRVTRKFRFTNTPSPDHPVAKLHPRSIYHEVQIHTRFLSNTLDIIKAISPDTPACVYSNIFTASSDNNNNNNKKQSLYDHLAAILGSSMSNSKEF